MYIVPIPPSPPKRHSLISKPTDSPAVAVGKLGSPPAPNAKAYTSLHPPQLLAYTPYPSDAFANFLSDRYARCAWVVPVRGGPTHPECTFASVLDIQALFGDSSLFLDDECPLPSGPASHAEHQDAPGSITWTPDALCSLWKFLNSIREARHLGDIGLSFFCVDELQDLAFSSRLSLGGGGQAGLHDFDHIKVHVDARYALRIRDILHLWRYECLLPTAHGGGIGTFRLLHGARLLLVDEVNRGLAIS